MADINEKQTVGINDLSYASWEPAIARAIGLPVVPVPMAKATEGHLSTANIAPLERLSTSRPGGPLDIRAGQDAEESTVSSRSRVGLSLRSTRRQALLARRRWVGDFEGGPRTTDPEPLRYRLLKPALMPWSATFCVFTQEPVLSLTFDDGPDPRHTPQVLDALAARDARATFFMLSSSARRHPALVCRVVAEGHEIALHGIDHSSTTEHSNAEAARRLKRGQAELEDVAQRWVRLFRPTYGALRPPLVPAARRLGMQTVLWSGWARDWEGDAATEMAARAQGACHPGGVLLLHDTLEGLAPGENPAVRSAELTALLLERLCAEEWDFLLLSELLQQYRHIRSPWFLLPGQNG